MKMLLSDLLPNLILWLVLLMALWAFIRKVHPRYRTLISIGPILLFITSLPIGSSLLNRAWMPHSMPFDDIAAMPGHAVMVFGAGMSQDDYGNSWPSSSTMVRGFAGSALAERLNLPLYISGGTTGETASSEALLMADYLIFSGYQGQIEIDESALNTWENALAARQDRGRTGWSGYVVVTDPLHGRRALASLHALDVPVAGFVAARDLRPIDFQDFVPSIAGLLAWRGPVYEITASLYYMTTDRIDLDDLLLAGDLPR